MLALPAGAVVAMREGSRMPPAEEARERRQADLTGAFFRPRWDRATVVFGSMV